MVGSGIDVYVKRLDPGSILPTRSYPGDAGYDLYTLGDHVIGAGKRKNLPTGIAMALPNNMWAHIMPRSSTIIKHGLIVIHGVIDSGWRGDMFVIVYNPEQSPVFISSGTRLAQMILHEIAPVNLMEVMDLPDGERGHNGFGSTGK